MGDSHNAEAPYHQAISLSENIRETEFLRIKLEEVSNHRLVHWRHIYALLYVSAMQR